LELVWVHGPPVYFRDVREVVYPHVPEELMVENSVAVREYLIPPRGRNPLHQADF
jgi:hypothetical protein